MKTFSDERKLRELIVSGLALKGLLNEFPQAEGKWYKNKTWGENETWNSGMRKE